MTSTANKSFWGAGTSIIRSRSVSESVWIQYVVPKPFVAWIFSNSIRGSMTGTCFSTSSVNTSCSSSSILSESHWIRISLRFRSSSTHSLITVAASTISRLISSPFLFFSIASSRIIICSFRLLSRADFFFRYNRWFSALRAFLCSYLHCVNSFPDSFVDGLYTSFVEPFLEVLGRSKENMGRFNCALFELTALSKAFALSSSDLRQRALRSAGVNVVVIMPGKSLLCS